MSTTPLRQDIKKLAADNPTLRPLLLPLLRMAGGPPRYVPQRIASAIDKLATRALAAALPRMGAKVVLMFDTLFDNDKGRAVKVPAGVEGAVVGMETVGTPSAAMLDQLGPGAYEDPRVIVRFGRYGNLLVEPSDFQRFGGNKTPRVMKVASAVIVGDIFYSKWGYGQTNLDYYQVVKTTAKTIALRKIDKRLTRGRGEPTEYYMPVANKFVGPPMRKKLKEYSGKAYVDLTSYSSAYKWDGKEQSQTGGAYGH